MCDGGPANGRIGMRLCEILLTSASYQCSFNYLVKKINLPDATI